MFCVYEYIVYARGLERPPGVGKSRLNRATLLWHSATNDVCKSPNTKKMFKHGSARFKCIPTIQCFRIYLRTRIVVECNLTQITHLLHFGLFYDALHNDNVENQGELFFFYEDSIQRSSRDALEYVMSGEEMQEMNVVLDVTFNFGLKLLLKVNNCVYHIEYFQ